MDGNLGTVQKTVDSLRIVHRQFSSALKVSTLSDEITKIHRALNHSQEMMRTILGPIEDLRRLTLPSLTLNDHIQSIAKEAQTISESFRLIKTSELEDLFNPHLTPSVASAMKHIIDEQDSIKNAMQAMHTPWINTEDISRSFQGFSELQSIGVIIQNCPTFDDKTADFLRVALGDWRSLITWPSEIFENPIVRSSFYEHQGFNPALTEFPAPAFQEGLSIAGLREAGPSDEDDSEDSLFDEDGLLRTNQAHARLQRFEMAIRRFIEKKMIAVFGPGWIKQQVPGDIWKRWQEKREIARAAGEPERPLIEYADFTDYTTIIMRNDNWQSIFKPIFKRQTLVQESFQRLYPIRICTMHARIITQDDELYLYVETKRILKIIGFDD